MSGAIPTIAEAARQIAARQLSPIELTRACLDRVHKLDGELHAVNTAGCEMQSGRNKAESILWLQAERICQRR